MVTLPTDVTEDDAKAIFKNGILEVRLKKRRMLQKSRIAIGLPSIFYRCLKVSLH